MPRPSNSRTDNGSHIRREERRENDDARAEDDWMADAEREEDEREELKRAESEPDGKYAVRRSVGDWHAEPANQPPAQGAREQQQTREKQQAENERRHDYRASDRRRSSID